MVDGHQAGRKYALTRVHTNRIRSKKGSSVKRDFLGDSYDLVKSFWHRVLAEWAPLFADPRFIPDDLRADYSRLTGIKMLPVPPIERFSIINDPDVGIRLPGEENQGEGCTHTTMSGINIQLEELGPKCIITFDQSNYRHSGYTLGQQHRAKLEELRRRLKYGFYYVSHALFLFAFKNQGDMQHVRTIVVNTGIPASKIQLSN